MEKKSLIEVVLRETPRTQRDPREELARCSGAGSSLGLIHHGPHHGQILTEDALNLNKVSCKLNLR
jgi:hypothetical protein